MASRDAAPAGSGTGDPFLDRVVAWAERQPDVRALVLTGSRARPGGPVDDASDYDLEVFTSDRAKYETDEWMDELGAVWVYLPTTRSDDSRYLTRLVVFAGATKVDFSFAPPDVLADMAAAGTLSPLYERGYRMLLDREGLAARLPEPSLRPPPATCPARPSSAPPSRSSGSRRPTSPSCFGGTSSGS